MHSARTAKLDLRLSPEAKARLHQAASDRQQSVSQFVLKSALDEADHTLASRRHFLLDSEQWTAFLQALDAPPRPLPRLAALLQKRSVFDPE